jgi:hypothetical protein
VSKSGKIVDSVINVENEHENVRNRDDNIKRKK